jgi:hypothetical protein
MNSPGASAKNIFSTTFQGLRIEIIKAGSHDFRPEDFAERSTLAFGFERSFARV